MNFGKRATEKKKLLLIFQLTSRELITMLAEWICFMERLL